MRTKDKAKIGLAGVLVASAAGCAALGTVMMGSDDPFVVLSGAAISEEDAHYKRIREAQAGGSHQVQIVNFGGNTPGQGYQSTQTVINQNFFACNKVVSDGKGALTRGEIFGLGKRVFNLNEERITVVLAPFRLDNSEYRVKEMGGMGGVKKAWGAWYSGKKLVFSDGKSKSVALRTWTSSGELVGETINSYQPGKFSIINWTGPNTQPSGPLDFMDRLKQAGPGDYRITANIEGGPSYSLNIRIVE